MLVSQNVVIAPRSGAILNRIIVIRIHPARKRGRKLPERIIRHARVLQHRLLVRLSNGRLRGIGRSVLLEHYRLPRLLADEVVLNDPLVAPGVVVAPLIGVQVESAVVESGDGEILHEINAFVAGIRVGSIAEWGRQPAFIANGDHVVGVEGLDVCTDV